MLTTSDLYERPSYGIENDYRVKFKLLRGRTVVEYETSAHVIKSRNHNTNRSFTITIDNLLPQQPGELEIRGRLPNGKKTWFMLSDCRDLKILD